MENQENMSENKGAGFVHLLKAAAAKQVKAAALAQSLTCLDAEALESLSSKWDWSKLSASHEIAWSIDLIRQFEDQWKWNVLSANTSLPWSLELYYEFQENWNWKILSANSAVSLSVYLMYEFEGEWDWKVLSARTDLPWTVNLIKLFIEHWSKRILSKNPVASIYLDLYKKFHKGSGQGDEDDYEDEDDYDEDDSDNITVWFSQSGEEGADRPNVFDFSEEELADLRTCIELVVSFDKDMGYMDDYPDAEIIGIEIIYDGVSMSDCLDVDDGSGYSFDKDDGELYGSPGPIIRFQLNQVVNIESFEASVRTLFLKFTSAHLREHTGEDAHYADCFDTTILSNSELLDYWDPCSPPEEFCGKVFHFPDGMPEGGCLLAGTDFILKRESWIKD